MATDLTAGLSTAPEPVGPPPDRRSRRPSSAPIRRGWRQLTSMRTALLLLFALALAAVPGSWLPQRGLNNVEVAAYFTKHPTLAPILDTLSMFAVFSSPWFAAIYLLLFVSLIGCLGPRIRAHAAALRLPPPAAPARFDRLPRSSSYAVESDPANAVAAARQVLRGHRWRVAARGEHTLSAEKGYLRETGNLLFHVCLVVLLVGIATGGLFGYKGNVLLVEGDGGFSNTLVSYDDFQPGRLVGADDLAPFTFSLRSFHASYQPNGAPDTFDAQVSYRSSPDGATRRDDVRVNHPLDVDGVKVYLLGHGYAPRLTVYDATGAKVFEQAVPCLPQDPVFTSACTVKVPATTPGAGGAPNQLGFTGFFTPTTERDPALGVRSTFPADRKPGLTLLGWRGDLGLDAGIPQSVYRLDTTHMSRIGTQFLTPGQSWALPSGGRLAFTGVSEWATFKIADQPGNGIALLAAVGIVAGLLLSLRVRRRRVWVRARPATAVGGPTTLVEVGGLARSDADTFGREFDDLIATLRTPRE